MITNLLQNSNFFHFSAAVPFPFSRTSKKPLVISVSGLFHLCRRSFRFRCKDAPVTSFSSQTIVFNECFHHIISQKSPVTLFLSKFLLFYRKPFITAAVPYQTSYKEKQKVTALKTIYEFLSYFSPSATKI